MEITNPREFPALWDNDYWEKVRQRTLKVIACIPPDKYDWRYAEGKFSFADIIRHLAAIERYMYAENVQLKPSRYPGHGPEVANGLDDSRASVLALAPTTSLNTSSVSSLFGAASS